MIWRILYFSIFAVSAFSAVKDIFSTIVERTLQKNLFLQNKAKLARFGQSGQSPHPSLIPKITSKQCKSVLISVKKLSVKSAQSASEYLVLIRENSLLNHNTFLKKRSQFYAFTTPKTWFTQKTNPIQSQTKPNFWLLY
jgi:hypothetical protein